jgi:hypothetical protein
MLIFFVFLLSFMAIHLMMLINILMIIHFLMGIAFFLIFFIMLVDLIIDWLAVVVSMWDVVLLNNELILFLCLLSQRLGTLWTIAKFLKVLIHAVS